MLQTFVVLTQFPLVWEIIFS